MQPLWIVLIGVAIVIGGVLLLRLHAFLALILAALAVGALTPRAAVERTALEAEAIPVERTEPDGEAVWLRLAESDQAYPGARLDVVRVEPRGARLAAKLAIARFVRDGRIWLAEARSIEPSGGEPAWRPRPGDLVVTPAARRAAEAAAEQTVGRRVAEAFGGTCAKIGVLIAMAAIIGKCLLDSGAADKIVRFSLRLLGESRAPAALVGSSFLLGIPVFFDTVFYLMIPLGKALRLRTGRHYLLYVLSIVAGGTMAHSLVPPTPGPLFVAEELQIDLGLMIMAGTVVGLCASTAAYVFARALNRRMEIPLRESPDFSLQELEQLAARDERELPPLWLSLTPILLPVVLIAGYTVIQSAGLALSANWMAAATTLGDKNLALTLAAVIAMGMLMWQRRSSLKELARAVQGALVSGGVIILITSAGGAFGRVLQQTGVAGLIRDLPQASPPVVLLLAFLVAAAIRTAQGSATVSMITSVGVLGPLAGQLAFHPVYLALAIGCGSKPIAWMNDSGFWVICKMSGMTETEGLKTVSPMSVVMGAAGLAATIVLALLIPLK